MISDLLNKKIEDLKNKVFINELDIISYFLPDEEVVKNIIRSKNPLMTPEDINIMVYGYDYKPPISEEIINTSKSIIVKNKYSFEVLSNNDSFVVNIIYGGKSIGSKSFNLDYTATIDGVAYTGAEAALKTVENEAKNSGFNFDGISYPKSEETKVEKKALETLEKIEDNIPNINLRDFDPFPLGKGSAPYKEVSRIKDEVRKSIMLLNLSKKELVNQLVSSLTLLNSSIPGIALMVSAPPWNIPAAISMASLILSSLNDLISKAAKFITYLSSIKMLDILLSSKNFNKIARILNAIISVISAILDPIERIKKFILSLIEKIKSLFNANSCRKQIRRVNRQISKKTRELSTKNIEIVKNRVAKNAAKVAELQEEIDDLNDELVDLRTQLEELNKNCGKKIALEDEFDQLNELVNTVNSESDAWIDSLTFNTVYDVLLPDGTTLNGLTEEQLNNLKQDYTIVFNN